MEGEQGEEKSSCFCKLKTERAFQCVHVLAFRRTTLVFIIEYNFN